MNNDLVTWITYHDDRQLEEYGLKETESVRLFKGNDTNVEGENINHLNAFYSEMTTMYWVWKNNKKSKKVCFSHYRRRFREFIDILSGQCQVLDINRNCSVFYHYKTWHNYQDMYDMVDILNEKYGEGNIYSEYLLKSNVFIPYCCFMMHWEDFDRLCKFLFPILFAFDTKNGLDMTPMNYVAKAQRDFRHDNVSYQQRAISFLAERLISCYLVCEMEVCCLNIL